MGDQMKTVAIGAAGLQYLLRRDVGDTNDWPVIPLLIAQADRGDFSLLGRLAGRRLAGLGSGMNLMPLAVDCASGAPVARLQRIRELEPSRYFGLMTNYPYPAACEMLSLPMLPDAFRTPVTSQAPTLFVSGTLDSNTPPAQADAVAARFSHAVHLVIENAGHESTLRRRHTGCDRVLRRGKAAHVRAHCRPGCPVSPAVGTKGSRRCCLSVLIL